MEKALQNVTAQSFTNYELLILDAVSTDSTKAIVGARLPNNRRIALVSEADKGIYDAMNRGIERAKGDWIYFMGCDDELFDPNTLQTIATYLTDESDLVYGDVLWIPDNIIESGECTPLDLINRNINHQRIFYSRKLFQQFGGYDLQYKIASDHELNIRFFCNDNIRKKYIPFTIARYHSGGFSANKIDKAFWKNWKKIFRQNFTPGISTRVMYEKLGWYCRYNIGVHQYSRAFILFWDVFLHTFSPGFVLLTFRQFVKSIKKNAG